MPVLAFLGASLSFAHIREEAPYSFHRVGTGLRVVP